MRNVRLGLPLAILAIWAAGCGAEGEGKCPPGSRKQGKVCVADGPSTDGPGAGANGSASAADGGASAGRDTVSGGGTSQADGGTDTDTPRCKLYRDEDSDGYGDPERAVDDCMAGEGWVADKTDCDDQNDKVHPGAPERCDEIDNDCDGDADEDLGSSLYLDADGDGWGSGKPVTVCKSAEYVSRDGDCDDQDSTVHPEADELCDNKDNDCDFERDEGARITYYVDCDRDGYAAGESGNKVFCRGEQPMPTDGACGFTERAPDGADIDCDDGDEQRTPNKEEICDGIDNNCKDGVDEGLRTVYFLDEDGDGYGDTDKPTEALCEQPVGAVPLDGDCNDDPRDAKAASIHPGVTDVCDYVDNDCDGDIDQDNDGNSLQTTKWSADCDGDGYLVQFYPATSMGCAALAPPTKPKDCKGSAGLWRSSSKGKDCDDENAAINAGAKEVCDGIDNNCTGGVDEGVKITYYPDCDGDGYTTTGHRDVEGCTEPPLSELDCPRSNGTMRWITQPLAGSDCGAYDKNAYPGSTSSGSTPIYGGTSDGKPPYDYNCDGMQSQTSRPPLLSSPCDDKWRCGESLDCTVGYVATCGDAYTLRTSGSAPGGGCLPSDSQRYVSCQ